MALLSHMARLGSSDPVELRGSMEELVEGFDINRFGAAPTKFDEQDLFPLTHKLSGTLPAADKSDATAATGNVPNSLWVSGNRPCSSNLVGAAPNRLMSNPSTNSSIDPRSSTGSDDPSRAIWLNSAIGSTPCSRKSRNANTPSRFDNASPCGPVSNE